MQLFLLLSLAVTLCRGHYDNEDWTDPTDMFNYDAATGKMIPLKPNPEKKVEGVCEKEGEDTCLGNNNALVVNTEKSKPVPEEHGHKEDFKLPESNSNPVFRRYLRKVLNEAERFGLPEDSGTEIYYNAEMVLTKQMLVEIQKFIDDEDWNVGALEDALIRTLVQFRYHNVKEWWTGMFEDYLGIDLDTTWKIVLCIAGIVWIIATETWSLVGWFTQIKRLCILSFFVSVAWNWLYLYKVAFAERQAEMAKMQKFDGSCGEKISWSESLFEWFKGASTFQNDPCEEYFKSLMINPALMVPPTKALALTFTDFITEPLKHIGKAMGEFLKGLLAEIPVFYQLLVLLLIAVIILASCYGASTTIPKVLMHRNNRDPPQERLPLAEPQRPHGNAIEGWHGNNGDTARERLPLAEPQRPPYGNAIEGWHQQPYFIGPQYVPVYIHPRNQRPESLQAMDISDGKNNMHPPGESRQEPRNEEFTEPSGRKTAERILLSAAEKHQGKEEPKERSHSARPRECEPVQEQLQRKDEPRERRPSTKNEIKPDSIQEITNSTPQGKTKPPHQRSCSQEPVEVKNGNGEYQREEEPPHEQSPGHPHRRELSVEEISAREQSWNEGNLHDKSLKGTEHINALKFCLKLSLDSCRPNAYWADSYLTRISIHIHCSLSRVVHVQSVGSGEEEASYLPKNERLGHLEVNSTQPFSTSDVWGTGRTYVLDGWPNPLKSAGSPMHI